MVSGMCYHIVSLFVLPDPSLSSENLSTVLDIMDDRLWWNFSEYINVPDSESEKINYQYSSDREHKQALIPHLISTHPSLSWGLVARALYQMGPLYLYGAGDDGDSCHRALDHLQQKFPTGSTYCKHYNTSLGDFPHRDGSVSTISVSPPPT